MKRSISVIVVLTWCVFAPCARADFVLVDLSPYANARIQNYQPPNSNLYPEGMVTLGGIPFNIQAVGGNNAWNAEVVTGPYPHVLSIPLSIPNAMEVHTLINTFYGQPGPTSYIKLEFLGSNGAYFSKELIGNVDVRDHFFSNWTNSINGTSSINVFTTGGGPGAENRLDKQQIILPPVFEDQTLTEFRLTSTGGVSISDATIQGLTVISSAAAPVPEPSTIALLSLGGVSLIVYGWRRERRRL
jgi:hypothetical protein